MPQSSRVGSREQENAKRLENAIATLRRLIGSGSIPKRAAASLRRAIDVLVDPSMVVAVRAANAIDIVEEVMSDAPASRTALWSVVVELESVRS